MSGQIGLIGLLATMAFILNLLRHNLMGQWRFKTYKPMIEAGYYVFLFIIFYLAGYLQLPFRYFILSLVVPWIISSFLFQR